MEKVAFLGKLEEIVTQGCRDYDEYIQNWSHIKRLIKESQEGEEHLTLLVRLLVNQYEYSVPNVGTTINLIKKICRISASCGPESRDVMLGQLSQLLDIMIESHPSDTEVIGERIILPLLSSLQISSMMGEFRTKILELIVKCSNPLSSSLRDLLLSEKDLLENLISILRKCGDVDAQISICIFLRRIAKKDMEDSVFSSWFPDPDCCQLFLSINSFYDIKIFLNLFNQELGQNQLVFSLPVEDCCMGGTKIYKSEEADQFWADMCLGSKELVIYGDYIDEETRKTCLFKLREHNVKMVKIDRDNSGTSTLTLRLTEPVSDLFDLPWMEGSNAKVKIRFLDNSRIKTIIHKLYPTKVKVYRKKKGLGQSVESGDSESLLGSQESNLRQERGKMMKLNLTYSSLESVHTSSSKSLEESIFRSKKDGEEEEAEIVYLPLSNQGLMSVDEEEVDERGVSSGTNFTIGSKSTFGSKESGVEKLDQSDDSSNSRIFLRKHTMGFFEVPLKTTGTVARNQDPTSQSITTLLSSRDSGTEQSESNSGFNESVLGLLDTVNENRNCDEGTTESIRSYHISTETSKVPSVLEETISTEINKSKDSSEVAEPRKKTIRGGRPESKLNQDLSEPGKRQTGTCGRSRDLTLISTSTPVEKDGWKIEARRKSTNGRAKMRKLFSGKDLMFDEEDANVKKYPKKLQCPSFEDVYGGVKESGRKKTHQRSKKTKVIVARRIQEPRELSNSQKLPNSQELPNSQVRRFSRRKREVNYALDSSSNEDKKNDNDVASEKSGSLSAVQIDEALSSDPEEALSPVLPRAREHEDVLHRRVINLLEVSIRMATMAAQQERLMGGPTDSTRDLWKELNQECSSTNIF